MPRIYSPEQREIKRLRCIEWAKKNKERKRAADKQNYLKNAEARRQAQRQWRAENREKHRSDVRRWQSLHPEEVKAYRRKANTQRREAVGGGISTKDWLWILQNYEYKCRYCGRSDRPLQKDHMMPLSRGGADDILNVAPACGPCNQSKRSKTAIEFMTLLHKIPA